LTSAASNFLTPESDDLSCGAQTTRLEGRKGKKVGKALTKWGV